MDALSELNEDSSNLQQDLSSVWFFFVIELQYYRRFQVALHG
jgi:hypothetical protein